MIGGGQREPRVGPVDVHDVLECLPLSAVLLDRNLDIQWLGSRALATLAGFAPTLPWSPRELVGRNIETLHPLPDFVRDLLHVPVRLPRHFSCTHGDWWVDFLLHPVLNETGNVGHLLLVFEVSPARDHADHSSRTVEVDGIRWSPVSHGRVPATLRIARQVHGAPATPTPEPPAPLPRTPRVGTTAFSPW